MEVLYSLNDFPPRSFCESKDILSVMNWSLKSVASCVKVNVSQRSRHACAETHTSVKEKIAIEMAVGVLY